MAQKRTTEIDRMTRERDAALLSMDRKRILVYLKRYDTQAWKQMKRAKHETFWVAVHKAITAAVDLPDDKRELSRRWLFKRGLSPLGDLKRNDK